jgi:hypothetical protein
MKNYFSSGQKLTDKDFDKLALPKSFQAVENRIKALKLLWIKLPTAMAVATMIVFFIMAICFNPMIPIRMMHQFISLASQIPLSFFVWLLLFVLMGGLALTRRKSKQ